MRVLDISPSCLYVCTTPLLAILVTNPCNFRIAKEFNDLWHNQSHLLPIFCIIFHIEQLTLLFSLSIFSIKQKKFSEALLIELASVSTT